MDIKEIIPRLEQLYGDVTVNDVIMKDPLLHTKKLSALHQTITYLKFLKEEHNMESFFVGKGNFYQKSGAKQGLKLTPTENFRDLNKEIETPKHYDNSKGSLYAFSEHHNLNSWEFDALKRIIRSRKKGSFEEDINKTITVLELYKKEYKKV